MTTRLDCDVTDTRVLLQAILRGTRDGARVMFLDSAGCGAAKMQAVRVRLSRTRNELKRKGKKLQHFNMHLTIHPHTEEGKRYDCVVVWRTKNRRHEMLESLEDLVGHGDEL